VCCFWVLCGTSIDCVDFLVADPPASLKFGGPIMRKRCTATGSTALPDQHLSGKSRSSQVAISPQSTRDSKFESGRTG